DHDPGRRFPLHGGTRRPLRDPCEIPGGGARRLTQSRRVARGRRVRLCDRQQPRAAVRARSATATGAGHCLMGRALKAAAAKPVEPFLPYGRQLIEDDDVAAVAEALRSDFLTTGPFVSRFEAALARTVQAREAVVCANGTAALHMAARA